MSEIKTKPVTPEYAENFDRIFNKLDVKEPYRFTVGELKKKLEGLDDNLDVCFYSDTMCVYISHAFVDPSLSDTLILTRDNQDTDSHHNNREHD